MSRAARLLLAACAPLTVRGALSCDGTIAWPQGGFAIVELRDTGPSQAVVAERRIKLRGQSLPVRPGRRLVSNP